MAGPTLIQGPDDPAGYRPRSYQTEMYEASLKGNIIVTVRSNSGKLVKRTTNGVSRFDRWALAAERRICMLCYYAPTCTYVCFEL